MWTLLLFFWTNSTPTAISFFATEQSCHGAGQNFMDHDSSYPEVVVAYRCIKVDSVR